MEISVEAREETEQEKVEVEQYRDKNECELEIFVKFRCERIWVNG